MTSTAKTPAEYLESLPEDRRPAVLKLREAVLKNLPPGFSEAMGYGMLGYVVPHGLYPKGYHCDPKQPLPFAGLASQKHSINFYHMGIYAMPDLMDWFVKKHAETSKKKLDMGKSCMRFKKEEDIPFELIGELCSKLSPQDWIEVYETKLRR